MTGDTKYNGWTNYESWSIALWIGNDRGTEELMEEFTNQARENDPEHPAYELSHMIKDYIEENKPVTDASLYSDLLQAAINSANYYEIAEHYLDDYPAETEEE